MSSPADATESGAGGAYEDPVEEVLKVQEIGFARLELRKLTECPWLEIFVQAHDRDILQEEIQSLLEFISEVLNSDQASNGFGLTYDLRLLTSPTVSSLMAIASWSAEPERKELFERRCIASKTCVPSGWKYFATKAAMSAFFGIMPPPCKTYLTTDFEDPEASSYCWHPAQDNNASSEKASQSSERSSGGLPRKAAQESKVVDVRPTSRAASSSSATSCWSCLAFCGRTPPRPKPPTHEEHQQALERIERLEETNVALLSACKSMQERMALLEEAVPWVTVTQQFNDMGKSVQEWAQGVPV